MVPEQELEQELLLAERHAALREAFADLPPDCRRLLALLIEDPGGWNGEPLSGDVSSLRAAAAGYGVSPGPQSMPCSESQMRSPGRMLLGSAGRAFIPAGCRPPVAPT